MSDDERTLIEENMVLKAPLSFELEAVGKAMVDLIQKAPAELRPAALAAAIAVIQGIQLTADASVEALPDYPISLSTEAIKAQAQYLNDIYKNLPPDAPAFALLPAMSLLQTVDGMVDPLSAGPPVFPHSITQRFLDHQANLLMEYVTENALK